MRFSEEKGWPSTSKPSDDLSPAQRTAGRPGVIGRSGDGSIFGRQIWAISCLYQGKVAGATHSDGEFDFGSKFKERGRGRRRLSNWISKRIWSPDAGASTRYCLKANRCFPKDFPRPRIFRVNGNSFVGLSLKQCRGPAIHFVIHFISQFRCMRQGWN